MKHKINANMTTTLLVGASIIGVNQATILSVSSATDARFEQVDARFEQVDARFERIDRRLDHMEARFVVRFERLESQFNEMSTSIARIEGMIQASHGPKRTTEHPAALPSAPQAES
ncbi:MAG: hypothetical protein F4171_09945 [Gammaproteobacteria bacterium]|nr:hypothetical protein [Gammaproteobacteria bacterium]MYG13105.1 hypothetical protein [Gammaproteobacteria bacterium]